MPDDRLEELVQLVRAGSAYRTVSIDLIRRVGSQELTRRRSFKEAVKQTRTRLHQVAGAYLGSKVDYAAWQAQLDALPRELGDQSLRDFCRRVMEQHASTRERLPILELFYEQPLSSIEPLTSILDIGCGLNPLSLPWMPLAEGISYLGLDIYGDLVEFLNRFLAHCRIEGSVRQHDLSQGIPTDLPPVQLALMLKIFPCLEQLDKTLPAALLRSVRADHLLVSFPVHSLGGRSKGMLAYYEEHFLALIQEERWRIKRFEFSSELAYLLSKSAC